MKLRALMFVFAFVAGPAHAAAPTLESAFARRLMRARNAGEIERLRGQFDRARVARLSCALQVARGTAPLGCYEILATERAWRILDERRFLRRRRRLDAACAHAALRLKVPGVGDAAANVSADCRGRVREAQLTRRYRDGGTEWSED